MNGNSLRLFVIVLGLAVCGCATTGAGTFASPASTASSQASEPSTSAVSAVENINSKAASSGFAPPPVLNPEGMTAEDATLRPFLYWRAWANQKLPLYRVFFFLLFAVNIISVIAPRLVTDAREPYESKWFRCLGLGVLFFTIAPGAAGQMARLGLFTPLATVIIAFVQLTALAGLSVAAQAIGDSIFRILHLNSIIKHPLLNRLASLCVGTLALSSISLIPGIGQMPRLGNRMLALVAAAGTGGLLMLFPKLKSRPNTAS